MQVGQYHVRVDALLGSGGYAEIYRVMDISNGQKYALKHLRLNGDQEIIKEVQQEAKTQVGLTCVLGNTICHGIHSFSTSLEAATWLAGLASEART